MIQIFSFCLRTGPWISVKFWARSKAQMGGFTFRIRIYKLEYNMTEVCFPFVLQSIQLQKLFVSLISCSERGSGLLNRREDQDWSKMWGSATLCGASQFLLKLVPLCRMDGRRRRKGCTKLLAGPWSHRHKPNLFVGCSDCLVLFLAEENVHIHFISAPSTPTITQDFQYLKTWPFHFLPE